MRLRTILIVANVALAGAAIAQLAVSAVTPSRSYVMASWKDRPSSLADTTRLSDTVVTGKVVKIRKADPIVTQLEGETDKIPVEVVTIELTDDDVKGKGKKGATIEVFHTGHSDAESPAMRKKPRGPAPPKPAEGAVEEDKAERGKDDHMAVLFSGVMEDPAYKVGEEYILFVRAGPTLAVGGQQVQTQAIVSPEGRYKVKADKTVEPMSSRDFARQLRGRGAKDLREAAAKDAGRGKPN